MFFEELTALNPELTRFSSGIPDALDGQFVLRSYEPGQIIHQKDSPLKRIGILLRGSFRVINEFENGNIFMVEMNEAVSFVGEVTLLAGAATTSVTIETVTDCLITYLPANTFDAWLKEDPPFLRAVCNHVAAKLYHATYNRGERLFYSAKYLLLKYITAHVKPVMDKGPVSVTLKKTRRQISEETGMTEKTINRTLSVFCREELISIQHGKITVTKAQHELGKRALQFYMTQSRNGSR